MIKGRYQIEGQFMSSLEKPNRHNKINYQMSIFVINIQNKQETIIFN